MPRAIKGVLVECDPSIKSIIVKIDSENHDYIVEDLDDQTLVIKDSKVADLKQKLDQALKDSQQPDKKLDSDSDI